MPTQDSSADDAYAFSSICTALSQMIQPDDAVPERKAAAKYLEQAAIKLGARVQPTQDHIGRVTQTGSGPLLTSLLAGANGDLWEDMLKAVIRRISESEDTYRDDLRTKNATAPMLRILMQHGFPLDRFFGLLVRPFWSQATPDFLAIMQELQPRGDVVEQTLSTSGDVFTLITKASAPTLLPELQRLMRASPVLFDNSAHFACNRWNWRLISLLVWLGYDFSRMPQSPYEKMAAIMEMTTSAHGRLRLAEMEPDFIDLLSRPKEAAFYGFSLNDL